MTIDINFKTKVSMMAAISHWKPPCSFSSRGSLSEKALKKDYQAPKGHKLGKKEISQK